MRTTRSLFFIVVAIAWAATSTLASACASDENGASEAPDAQETSPPVSDAAPGDGEAGPCTDDCEYFPEACAPDALCANGPFDPVDPNVGMDWRTRINLIRGRSPSDVWIAGTVGAVAHFDGMSWARSDVGTQESLRVLWLPPASEIAFGTIAKFYTRRLDVDAGEGVEAGVSAGGWSAREMPPVPFDFGRNVTTAASMPGSRTLWVATTSDLWRMRLTPESTFEFAPGIPYSICAYIPCGGMRNIHAASEKTLWAVGDRGAALRITEADGDAPVATPFNTMTWVGLTGVWAASESDVWAVGGTGTIRHYTGAPLRWDVVPDVPTRQALNAVWGTSSTDVWAVGNAGVVLHYDGARWSRVKVAGLGATRPDLLTVWSSGPGHLWVGGHGVVLALGGKP